MRIKVLVVAGALLAGGVVSVVNGCGSSDNNSSAARLSQKGEACQVTGDCASGLACVPVPSSTGNGSYVGICVTGEFHISVTAKECAITECSTAEDCCPTPPSNCPTLAQQCATSDAGTNSTACQLYQASCLCDTAKRTCDQNQRCQFNCTTDLECIGQSGSKCAGGRCVQCAVDQDCNNGGTNDRQCINGACQAPCLTDGDCSGFARCQAGKCLDSGCQTDRECVAATRNVEATCGTDGKCIVPCQTDLECGNPKSYSFFSCINHQCTYTGCQNDKDCRLFLTGPSDASTIGAKQHVVCRDKQLPTSTTTPAK